jgi:DNA-binding phage protein
MQLNLAKHIQNLTEGSTIAESAKRVGLTTNDIKNLRAGNMPSLRALLCVVRTRMTSPSSLISSGPLEALPKGISLRGATERHVKARIQRISRENDPASLAAESGLSIASIYQYRSLNDKIGLHAFLAFVSAGYDADELLLGGARKVSRA